MCLAVLLPILMAEILTGQEFHEWIGVVMAVLLILHHRLERKWWRNVGTGGFTPYKCISAMLNLFMLADILALVVSGIMMSGFVFDWLSISGGMILSRRFHLFASHWGMAVWLCRGIGAEVALFGVYVFIRQNMVDYLFLRTAFVFWDETKSAVLFFSEVLSMMGLFIGVGCYGSKFLKGGKSGRVPAQLREPGCGRAVLYGFW